MIVRPAFRYFHLAAVVLAATFTSLTRADELRVSAAASLADVLKEIDAAFEKETGTKVQLNLGASSMLARQIEEGAPADVFFSADLAKMDALEKKGLIDAASKQEQLSNRLVVIIPKCSSLKISSLEDLAGSGVVHLVTGDPKAVPVGVYAKEVLEKMNLWEKVRSKIVAAENVRAALAVVESGNAEAGIVYKTDALFSSKVQIAYELPATDGPKIVYPMAILKEAKNGSAARKYLEFLDAESSHASFVKHGFVVLPETSSLSPNPPKKTP